MDYIYERFHLKAPKTARFLEPQEHENEQVSYCFKVQNLGDDVQYAALSYVWGSPNPSEPDHILLEDAACTVTPNLLSALRMVERSMRQNVHTTTAPPLLWADQLCIDQTNNAEKSEQVAMMGELYAKAQTVYICLGSSPTARDAAYLIREVSQRIDCLRQNSGGISYLSNPQISDVDWNWYNSFNWAALKELLLQPWFSRVWVVQEAGLAKTAIALYSGFSFEWTSLMSVLAWLSEPGYGLRRFHGIPGWTTHQLWVSFDHSARNEVVKPRSYNFLDLISHAAYQFNATDPRDYIFAFLGHPSAQVQLRGDTSDLVIVPDYDDSIRSTFVKFALKWLKRSQRPHLFSCVNHESLPPLHAGKHSDRLHKLEYPTWCPRWDHIPLGGSRLVDESHGNPYLAAASTKFQFQDLTGDRIKVRGFTLDTITGRLPRLDELSELPCEIHTGDSKLSPGDFTNFIKFAFLCSDFLDKTGKSSSTSERITGISAFVATATAPPLSNERDQLLANFKAALFKAQSISDKLGGAIPNQYKNAINSLTIYCEEMDLRPPDHFPSRFLARLNDHLPGRRLFICESGYIGLGPRVVQSGDQCCIIAGGEVPLVLRPFDDTSYMLVGECYMDGVMSGMAVEDHEFSSREWCDFVIR